MRRAFLWIPLLTSSCVRPVLGHGRYILSYQGNSPGTDGAFLLDLNDRHTRPICDDSHESDMACIGAAGSSSGSDLLLLHPLTRDGTPNQKLMIASKEGGPPVLLTSSDPGIGSRNEALGAFSPVEEKVSFAVVEADPTHSSIWITDLKTKSNHQLTEISKDKYWYAYPSWTGDGTAIAYSRVERGTTGSLRTTIQKYDLKSGRIEQLESLSNSVSIAFAPKSSDIIAAWTALGLELFDSKSRRLLIPLEWRGTRRLVPYTLTFDRSGQFLLFSVYDASRKEGQVYQLSITDSKMPLQVFVKHDARITSISPV
jgi:hypothetical protein